MRWILITFLTAVLATSASAQGKVDLGTCVLDEAPTIPEGASASAEEMKTTEVEFRTYMASVKEALACHEKIEEGLAGEITKRQKVAIDRRYNKGVDDLNDAAANFNKQVRAFKDNAK